MACLGAAAAWAQVPSLSRANRLSTSGCPHVIDPRPPYRMPAPTEAEEHLVLHESDNITASPFGGLILAAARPRVTRTGRSAGAGQES